jgi:predicted Zn finger-like uncharacterized protein
MLFTRCPECETTFRVTDETLKKANGQVRCGRCASVFNAYAELHDPSAKNFEPEAAQPPAPSEAAAAPPSAAATLPAAAATVPAAAAPPPAPAAASAEPAPAEPARSEAAPPAATAAGLGAQSLAAVVAAANLAAAADAREGEPATSGAHPETDLSATEVERVLTSNAGLPLPQSAYVWPAAGGGERRAASRWWAAAAALALLALGAQAVHHFRADLVSNPTFGQWIARAYATLGSEIAPHWDVSQYRIIDWIATAEPNSRGVGSLKITARIQNRGPLRQPYPAVQLRLKDRWEEAVGSRLFTPAEYLPRDTPRGRLMSPGETARAELEVVDPGPDAYGFELDVCIEVEASLVTCGSDEVFL